MTGVWALAALWLGLAAIAGLLSIWLRISTALSEIVVGTIAGSDCDRVGRLLFPCHGIINRGLYSALVAMVIAGAVVPTVVANAFYSRVTCCPESAGTLGDDRAAAGCDAS